MTDEQQEIDERVAAFFRNWEQYDATQRNPYYRGEAEQALKIAAQLAQVEQAKQLRRIADMLEDWRGTEQAARLEEQINDGPSIAATIEAQANAKRYLPK